MQVYTGKYNAEYGFTGSAVVNVVTRSGIERVSRLGCSNIFVTMRPNAKNFFSASKTLLFVVTRRAGLYRGSRAEEQAVFFGGLPGHLRAARRDERFASVPSDKMYSGDFSELYNLSGNQTDAAWNRYGQIYDPFTRQFDAKGKVIAADAFRRTMSSLQTALIRRIDQDERRTHLWGRSEPPGH